MNDFQTAIMLKILQFIMDGLSLFIFIYLSNIQHFIKNKRCFDFYIINILTSISLSFYFYNNVEMNKLLSIICFVSNSCIFTINAIKIIQLECSSC